MSEDAPGATTVDIPLVVLALFFVSTLVGTAFAVTIWLASGGWL